MLDVRRTESADRQSARETSNRVPTWYRTCYTSRGACSEVPAATRAAHAERGAPVPKRDGSCISPRGEAFVLLNERLQARLGCPSTGNSTLSSHCIGITTWCCTMPVMPLLRSPDPPLHISSHSFTGNVPSQWRKSRFPTAMSRRSSTR